MQTLDADDSRAREALEISAPDDGAPRRRELTRFLSAALEVVAALAGVGWMLVSSNTIYPFHALDRISQVSSEAALQVRFFVPVLLLIGLLLATLLPALGLDQDLAARLALSALPGLMSGFVAGGIALALRGTPLPLNGVSGDAGDMERWSLMLMHGQSIDPSYPPLFPRMVATMAELFTHHNVFIAYKYDEILLTALLGPAAYLAWRLVTGRGWSSVMAMLAVALLASPYKSYEEITLAMVIPSSIAYLRYLRRCASRRSWRVAVVGGVWGLVVAEIFLLFSGWYYWSAWGLGVAAAAVFPWRTGWRQGLLLIVCTAGAFLAVAWQSLIGLLNAAPDPYFFFATSVDPAYVAISVTDLPGQLAKGVWPPPGELGGVGVYTGLVIIALGIAVWLGFRRTAVITTAAIFAGAWLMRFYYASEMYRSNLVNYWTRTTLELEYLFVALAVFAIMLAAGRLRQSAAQHGLPETPGPARHAATAGLRASGTAAQQALPGLVALMLAGALFAGSAASAITDRFMPADNNSPGQLAWAAHHEKPSQLDTHVKTLVNGK